METHVCMFSDCLKTFTKKSRLEYHARSHTGEKPYKCDMPGCDKEYSRSDHLKRHKDTAHPEDSSDEKRWECESSDCEAAFKSRDGHRKHRKRCHSKHKYTCPVVGCGEEFRKHHQLKQHKHDVHHYTTAYSCSEPGCGKVFPLPSKLRRHMKVHEGYKCPEPDCELVFDKWSLLVKHKKVTHTSNKEHKCPTCQKTFSQKQWLRQHILKHESNRPVVVCPYKDCTREYLDQRNLNAHVRSYHEGKKFVCPREDCKRSFATKQKLELHGKMHDPNRPLPKKRKRRKQAEKLTGVHLESEGRGQNASILMSPNREDCIELPELETVAQSTTGENGGGESRVMALSRMLDARTEIICRGKVTEGVKLKCSGELGSASSCETAGENVRECSLQTPNMCEKIDKGSTSTIVNSGNNANDSGSVISGVNLQCSDTVEIGCSSVEAGSKSAMEEVTVVE